eukprot:scaffold142575_cov32-Tisochrysis_lutea.AAC.2
MLSLVATARRYEEMLRRDRNSDAPKRCEEVDGRAARDSDGDRANNGIQEEVDALGLTLGPSDAERSDQGGDDGDHESSTAASLAMEEFISSWSPEAQAAEAAGALLDGLGGELSPEASAEGGFRALVESDGWDDLLAAQRLLAATPLLRTILRSVGRGGLRGSRGWLSKNAVSKQLVQAVMRTHMPPEDADGVTRTSDVGRCTILELAALGSTIPAVRQSATLRLAEGSLVGRETIGWHRERAVRRSPPASQLRPNRDAGPLLVCLDTSGSMDGPHGTLARAAVLEALRQAQRSRRSAYVAAFGGKGELALMPLVASASALLQLADFLRNGFGGGTCVEAPLAHCISLVGSSEWAEADILLLTDGEFAPLRPEAQRALNDARETLGLRLHGLLVQRYTAPPPTAMVATCDELHVLAAIK